MLKYSWLVQSLTKYNLMLIYLYCNFLIITLIVMYVTGFYVAAGVSGSGCPIYIKIVYRYSLFHQSLNWAPILASIHDVSTCFIILNFICNYPFVYGITLGYFSYFPVFALNRSNWPPNFLLLIWTGRMSHCIYIFACHYIYTLLLNPGEWRSNLISVLCYLPCLLSHLFVWLSGILFLLKL